MRLFTVLATSLLLINCGGQGVHPNIPPSTCDLTTENNSNQIVKTTLNITVPMETPEDDQVYLSGDIEGWTGGGNPEFQAEKLGDGQFSLTISSAPCQVVQYKITRGDWNRVETDETGNSTANRRFRTGNNDRDINIKILNWSDLKSPENTVFWETTPPLLKTPDSHPKIQLIGNSVSYVKRGDAYEEFGALAFDKEDGNISLNVIVKGDVDTNIVGDYVLNYQVMDSDENPAVDVLRFVRVYDEEFSRISIREIGSTPSHLGYLEHLPYDFGKPGKKFPLLISHHGGGADASSIGGTSKSALATGQNFSTDSAADAVTRFEWPYDSPMIVLSPQRNEFAPPNFENIKAFVEYAKHYYPIDETRVYMSGWSQGGLVSLVYGSDYPGELAAVAPIAGGFFLEPNNSCGLVDTPVWALHGIDDVVVPFSRSVEIVERLNSCEGSAGLAQLSLFPGQNHRSIVGGIYSGTLIGQEDPETTPFTSLHDWFLAHSIEQ